MKMRGRKNMNAITIKCGDNVATLKALRGCYLVKYKVGGVAGEYQVLNLDSAKEEFYLKVDAIIEKYEAAQ